ncbi:MAG: ATP-binding protein [Leptolyngbyaceae bacterium]|nr:ATP-binding protein [Leptolyngbyaceae bacterium]
MYQSLDYPEDNNSCNLTLAKLLLHSGARPAEPGCRQSLEAELWFERCSNQLSTSLQRSFTTFLAAKNATPPLLASQIEAEILQTTVNDLYAALGSGMVAIALPQTKSEQTLLSPLLDPNRNSKVNCKICHVAPQQPCNLPFCIVLSASRTIRCVLGEVLSASDLQLLQARTKLIPAHTHPTGLEVSCCGVMDREGVSCTHTNEPCLEQMIWPLITPQGLLGWLLVCTPWPEAMQISNPTSHLQLRNRLIEQFIQSCTSVLHQLRLVQTDRIQSKKLELQNRQLMRTNQLKSEFLANTSHEIRTPLSSILGFTHFLREQGYSPSNLRHQEYLNIILSSGQHLLALINDILDLSKVEANQLDLQWETIHVADICKSVFDLLKERAADKGLALRLDINPDVTTFVADPLRLKQMLFNLLSNALKFTNRGSVGLQVRVSEVFLHFTVWDTGIGIAKEQQKHLFRPYSQILNSAVSRDEGTGLGLALTQKLVELHRGWIEVNSELNQGSQFTIVLPLNPQIKTGKGKAKVLFPEKFPDPISLNPIPGMPASKSLLQPIREQEPTSPGHSPLAYSLTQSVYESRILVPEPDRSWPILLVEDHPASAKLMMAHLGQDGYGVTWAKRGQEMWQALETAFPGLILMDIHLPDIDGLTLLKQLQAYEAYRTIPVIVQTAMAMMGDRETCLAAGATDYISKPIDFKVLAQLVAQYVGKKKS